MDIAALRTLLARFGTLRPQPASDWTGDLPLHPDLERFYRDIGPSGDTTATETWRRGLTLEYVGNPTWLPPLSHLWAYQDGYRWLGTPENRLAEWQDNWLVIADEGLDPYILDLATGEVLTDYHAQGYWEPDPAFPDLFTMAAWLGARAAVYREVGGRLNRDFEDGPAFRPQLLRHLSPVMGSSEAEALATERCW